VFSKDELHQARSVSVVEVASATARNCGRKAENGSAPVRAAAALIASRCGPQRTSGTAADVELAATRSVSKCT
jgi:hypothetical protein